MTYGIISLKGGAILNKPAKKILKFLNKHSSFKNSQTVDDIKTAMKLEEYIVEEAIQFLVSENLIKSTFQMMFANEIVYSVPQYYSSITGKDYFRNGIIDWIHSLLDGIVFPCIVAFITTIIVNLLG